MLTCIQVRIVLYKFTSLQAHIIEGWTTGFLSEDFQFKSSRVYETESRKRLPYSFLFLHTTPISHIDIINDATNL
jgi:hypothetical protein